MSLVSITRYRRGAAAGEGGGAGGLGGLGGGGLGLPAAASNLNSPLPFNETPIVVVLRRSPMPYHPVARALIHCAQCLSTTLIQPIGQ
jgi:hypothetical protein